jgi:hypothetical protein
MNKKYMLLIGVVGAFAYFQYKKKDEVKAVDLQTFGFNVPGLKADHFGRPAVIDGVRGILV